MASDWKRSRSNHICSVTGQILLPGEVCYTALREDGEDLIREEFSAAGWKDQDPKQYRSYWRTVIRLPHSEVKQKVRRINYDALYAEFRDMTKSVAQLSNEELVLRHLIALVLVRKRLLRLDSITRVGRGQKLSLYDSRLSRVFEIATPAGSATLLHKAQARLEELLQEFPDNTENIEALRSSSAE